MQSHTTCPPPPSTPIKPLTLPLPEPPHTHTSSSSISSSSTNNPPGILMSYLLGSESEEECKYRLCHTRFLVHAFRSSLAKLMGRADCFSDEEVVEPRQIPSTLCPLPCQRHALPQLWRLHIAAARYPEIMSARLRLFSCCSDGRMVKSYPRLSRSLFHHIPAYELRCGALLASGSWGESKTVSKK